MRTIAEQTIQRLGYTIRANTNNGAIVSYSAKKGGQVVATERSKIMLLKAVKSLSK